MGSIIETRVTIKDVAREAGVSIATVSRVLNKKVFVTDEMQQKVLDAAHSLNYIPNTAAKSLKTNHTNTIGFLISDISSEVLITAAQAAESIIIPENFNMILCNSQNDPRRERNYLKMLMGKNVDAIVINATGKNTKYIVEIAQRVPMVCYNRCVQSKQYIGDLVDTNNYMGSYLLTRKLLEYGHRRILLVRGPKYLSNAEERFNGFADAMKEVNIDVRQNYPYIFTGEFCRQTGMDAIDFLMRLKEPPTAIFSQNITTSIGVLTQANLRKINIPNDISFVSYDGIPNSELMTVQPTAVIFDTVKMGKQIGKSILHRVKDPLAPNNSYIFDPILLEGNSLAIPSETLKEKLKRL